MIIAGIDITDGTIFELLSIAAVGGSLMQKMANVEKKVDKLSDVPEKIARIESEVEHIKENQK
jgi:hypothetical protein